MRGLSLLLLVAAPVSLVCAACSANARTRLSIAVPAYFVPGPALVQLAAAVPPVAIVVMNPNNGPGTALDPAYVQAVQAVRRSGGRVLGYVHTLYGRRDGEEVRGDVDRYVAWYGVGGIFFDEASTDCALQLYYAALDAYVTSRNPSGFTMLNPRTPTAECFMAATDLLVMFEGSLSSYRGSDGQAAAPRWASHYPAERFCHIVFAAASGTEMRETVRLARARHAGYVYVTSGVLPNPYDGLPERYWPQELDAVH
jgi:hypothetical protein